MKAESQRLNHDRGELMKQLNEYRIKIDQVSVEFDRLHIALNSIKQENTSLHQQIY